MKNKISKIKNKLIPCFLLSALTGITTGLLIFAFKIAASYIIALSGDLYALVRQKPLLLVPFILGLAVLGLLSYFILKIAPDAKGGGIPSAITIIRGFVPINWVASAFGVFSSALVTFFAGIPLGNEGPSVQMGCAVGKGTVNILAKKNKAWDKYIMTGGACAGFAAATGAPISGLLFYIEEIHRRFSPLIFMSTATATLSSAVTMELLGACFDFNTRLFHFTISSVLPMKYLPVAMAVGIITGFVALGFTQLYKIINKFLNVTLKKCPSLVKIVSVFVTVGILGFFASEFTHSGHSLIDSIIEGHRFPMYLLLLSLLVRALLLLFANNAGITGGIFVPSLAFGALTGKISADILAFTGLVPEEYEVILVVIGMASFLAASSRIPLIAITFSIEALSGLSNIIPIALGAAFAYIVVELSGITDISDVIIESKIENAAKGKKFYVADVRMKVEEHAFVIGQEIRDILWPPTCVVLSVDKKELHHSSLEEGDVLHLRYKTSDPAESLLVLESLLGKQSSDPSMKFVHGDDEHYNIPEN
ncbi:MAG: hypothetical protein E7675_02870 [Ruminococcaceae bacterium]|nr:hypothetical protein [Oscillospiraceae bacterium]